MISREKPANFDYDFDVASCFVEHAGEILLLHRRPEKIQGNRWGTPAGKIDSGEDVTAGLCREIKEETGLAFSPEEVTAIARFYVQYPEIHFIIHTHYLTIDARPGVELNDAEHQDFQWVTPAEALETDLVLDEDHCIKHFYNL